MNSKLSMPKVEPRVWWEIADASTTKPQVASWKIIASDDT